jgi:LPXTG-site transpeptidase (sortase) family protein
MKSKLSTLKKFVTKHQTLFLYIIMIIESAVIILFTSNPNHANQTPSPSPQNEQIVSYPNESDIFDDAKDEVKTNESNLNEQIFNASDPKLIQIPSININAYIQQVGINEDNEIAVPGIEGNVGWYIYSVKPGQKGLSIIDGHVDSTSGAGVFRNLKDLKIDDTFWIEYGDGSTVTFKVIDKKQVSVSEANTLLFSKRSDVKEQLNLITCGGNYHADEFRYDDRIIIVTEKVTPSSE